MPKTLDFKQGSALSCAAVMSWNAFYGLVGNVLKAGDTVLTQGTGEVSMYTLQFAKAAGARVIATTSSETKAQVLKSLGANHVINYQTEPHWGSVAAKSTPGGLGGNHTIEVGEPKTMAQSLQAIKVDGCITIIEFVGGAPTEQQPTFLECLRTNCVVRGVYRGIRMIFEEMNQAIDAKGIKPDVDMRVYALEEVKEEYIHMWNQKHIGKVTASLDRKDIRHADNRK